MDGIREHYLYSQLFLSLSDEHVLIPKAGYCNDDPAYRAVDTESNLSFE